MVRLLRLFLVLALVASCGSGGREEFAITLRCIQAEGESLGQTRRECCQEAQFQAVEQASEYLRGLAADSGYQLPAEELRALASDFVRTELVDEIIEREKDSRALVIKFKAVIAAQEAREQLAKASIKAPATPPPQTAPAVVQQVRESTLPEQPALVQPAEVRKLAMDAPAPAAGQPESLQAPAAHSLPVLPREEELVKGMTPVDVAIIMGPADSIKLNEIGGAVYECRRHAGYWVVFRDGQLACVKTRLEHNPSLGGDCHCQGLSMNFLLR